MIPEIGNYALGLALAVTIVQATLPLMGATLGITAWTVLAKPAARAQLLFIAIAYACLTYAFVTNDFSVAYVANNSNTELPLIYRISGVWGAHEGSLLLWSFILALWTGLVSVFSRSIPQAMVARVLSVMGMVSIGFLLFMLLTSNPFDRLFPIPAEGRDLNPLLQDPGLAIHPPMLYLGYVGFSVAFAFAVAALIEGRLDTAWARWSRPWTTVAWLFLTIGITLGSWWAYYELGWGGWWFWDPVENASFMPWLVGTALVHSLAVTDKRSMFKAWTALLAVFAFSLSLLGTFLVRSGVLTSVHAFASDPARGVFILIFLAIVVGGSLTLYALRAPRIRGVGEFAPVSRESALLLNNVLLVVTACTVLLGTLYPLVLDALQLGKISVGPPYFNTVFVPLTVPLAALAGIGAMLRWKRDSWARLRIRVLLLFAVSVLVGIGSLAFSRHGLRIGAAAGLILGIWLIVTTAYGLYVRIAGRGGRWHWASTPRAFYGMTVAHLGVGVFIVGVTMTTAYSVEKDLRVVPGDVYELAGLQFYFDGVDAASGPNYIAQSGRVRVFDASTPIATLEPEKRTYRVQRSPMTEAGIDAGLTRDIYVSLGEPLGADGAWALRIYYKPFIRWIWLGGLLMALGGGLAASDRRYRLARRQSVAVESGAVAAPG